MKNDRAVFGNQLWRLTGIIASCVTSAAHAGNSVIFVNANAAPGGDGLSWATAFQTLDQARMLADPSGNGATTFGQVWVAAGTYFPTLQFDAGDPKSRAVVPSKNLSYLGGFIGDETSASQRDSVANETVISGDIGIPGNPSDNVFHVIRTFSATNSTAVMDGFTIRGGRAVSNEDRGAGIYNNGGSPTFSNCRFLDNVATWTGAAAYSTGGNMSFLNCTFTGHAGVFTGGSAVHSAGAGTLTISGCRFEANSTGSAAISASAIYTDCEFIGNSGGNAGAAIGAGKFTNCVFSGNVATFNNGGAVSQTGGGTPFFDRCTFIDNAAGNRGGAIAVSGNSTIKNCLFFSNSSTLDGGGAIDATGTASVANCQFLGNSCGTFGGAVSLHDGSLTMTNCVMSGNMAQNGGGVHVSNASAAAVRSCTFSNNAATAAGGGFRSTASSNTSLANCIVWGNSVNGSTSQSAQVDFTSPGTIDYSCVQSWSGGLGGTGNHGLNPQMINANGADGIPGTLDDLLTPLTGSPCIDAGSNSLLPADALDLDGDLNFAEPLPVDVLGNARLFDDPATADAGAGPAPIVDMGAFEYDGARPPSEEPGEYVGKDGGTWFAAANWAGNAVPDSSTNVVIRRSVLIDQAGAIAHNVSIRDGGHLTIASGSLVAGSSVTVEAGGALTLQSAASIQGDSCTIASGGQIVIVAEDAMLTFNSFMLQSDAALDWTAGIVRILGGTFASAEELSLGCDGHAALRIADGGILAAPAVTVCSAGRLECEGTIDAAIVTNSGTLSPGESAPGLLTVNGAFHQTAGGILLVEMGGYLPVSEHDQLIVNGISTLDGFLQLEFLDGFAPQLAGDQRVLLCNNMSGTFAALTVPPLASPFAFDLNHGVTSEDGQWTTVQLLTTLTSTNSRLYVRSGAAAGGDGQSWATATNELRAALDLAASFPDVVNEIWVAAGTYKPDLGNGNRSATFDLPPGVAVYGGFQGAETDLAQRDPQANPTILSGDLAGNDGAPGTFSGYAENSYHVVTMSGSSSSNRPRLDGFVISGGNANHPSSGNEKIGGGVFSYGDNAIYANCLIEYNHATGRGGGFLGGGGDTEIIDCRFIGNRTFTEAGGASIVGDPLLIDCLFEGNAAVGGFAAAADVANTSAATFQGCAFRLNSGDSTLRINGNSFFTVTLDGCVFEQNQSSSAISLQGATVDAVECVIQDNLGAGIQSTASLLTMNGCQLLNNAKGGIGSSGAAGVVNLVVNGCTFTGNGDSGRQGGGVRLSSGAAALDSCTFTDNLALEGGGLYLGDAVATLDDCVFRANQASSGSGIYNWIPGELRGEFTLLEGDQLFNAGSLRPGLPGPTGVTASLVASSFSQDDLIDPTLFTGVLRGNLFIELGGTVPGSEFDQVAADQATLSGGGLNLTLINGFQPVLGGTFRVLDCPRVTGSLDLATMPGLSNGQYLNLDVNTNGLDVSVELLDALLAFEDASNQTLGGRPSAAALADMDGDGDLDLVLAVPDLAAPASVAGVLSVRRNAGVDGQGRWLGFTGAVSDVTVGINPSSLVVGMFNGDAAPDIAVINAGGGTTSILFNAANGSGDLSVHQTLNMQSNPVALAGETTPGDLTVDLAVSVTQNRRVIHLINDGVGNYALGEGFDGARSAIGLRFADLDLDGDQDLVALRRDLQDNTTPSGIELLERLSGTNSLDQPIPCQGAIGGTDLWCVDMDLDGRVDVMTVNRSQGTLSFAKNRFDGGDLIVGSAAAIVVGAQPRSLAIADLDDDGDSDLTTMAMDSSNQPALRIVRNDLTAQGLFVAATASDIGIAGTPLLLVAGDVNNDGLDDLVSLVDGTALAGGAATISVNLNDTSNRVCTGDISPSRGGDGIVDIDDLFAVINNWGVCGGCPADLDVNGVVDVDDLFTAINHWGTCP